MTPTARKTFGKIVLIVCSILIISHIFLPRDVWAKIYLDINAPATRRMPIAVQTPIPLEGSEPIPLIAREIGEVLAGDL